MRPGDPRYVPQFPITTTASAPSDPPVAWAMPDAVNAGDSETVRLIDLRAAIRALESHTARPNVLIIHPQVKARLDYIAATVCIWALPGAIRWRGPDGKTWIEKQWKTVNEGCGNGNRAKRRMGLVPIRNEYLDEVEWVRKEEVHD